MADLTQILTTVTGTVTKTYPLSDPGMKRATDWIWYAYPQFEADGTTPKPKTNANVALAVEEWMDGGFSGTKANVLRHERSEAAQAASDAIADLG